MNLLKTYSQLITFPTFKDRLLYLKLDRPVCEETFGWDRYINQNFYRSSEWKRIRNAVIVRDNGCDLGVADYPINGRIIIHHINPVTIQDFVDGNPDVYNMENLISVSHDTHNAIHYGKEVNDPGYLTERKPNDTCPWKGGANA